MKEAEDFLKKLEEMIGFHKNLIDLLMKEKEFIIYEKPKELAELIIKKEDILNTIAEYKKNLKQNLHILIKYYGLESDTRMEQIIRCFPEEDKIKGEKLITKLKEYINNIRTVTLINKRLVEDTVNFMNFIIDFLKKPEGEVAVYSFKGEIEKKGEERKFLDIEL